MRAGRFGFELFAQLLLIANTLVVLVPLGIMVGSSFKSTREIFTAPLALPEVWRFGNYVRVWNESNLPLYLRNSLVVTSLSIALILVLGTMAAYALGRYRFRGNLFFYLFFLSGLMLPLRLAIIPLFLELKALGLLNTLTGLICVYAAQGLPSAVFILTGFFRALPKELEYAARVDGASEAQILFRIMLPLVRPALVIVGVYNLVPIWNDFFFPLIFINSPNLQTLPQGLTVFMGEFSTQWELLFAGLSVAALPVIVIYALLSKQFIRGLTAGAVKG